MLKGCEYDLEPLPLMSPPCFDTLCFVDPNTFASPAPEAPEKIWITAFQLRPLSLSSNQGCDEDSVTDDVQGPSKYDVICSRVKPFHQYPGSQRFRDIIYASLPAYISASTRVDKSTVIESIMDIVMDHPDGGLVRFLKYHTADKTWSVLAKNRIRDKIGHALREAIQEMQRAQRQKTYALRQVAARAS
jgi:hypothetical protein